MLVIPEAPLATAADAVRHYTEAGLKPVLIHAPVFRDGEPPGCSCSTKGHEPGPKNPWGSTGKHPISGHWQKGSSLDDLTNQLARLKFEPNVGLILGDQPAGGYVVAVDVDDEARFDELVAEHGPLPPTARCDSGRGYRLFYELPMEVPAARAKNVTGMGGKSGLDVKVEGGQVVVAPSKHPSGKTYTWTRWGGVELLPAAWALALWPNDAPLPAWAQRSYVPKDARESAGLPKRKRAYLEKVVREDARLLAACGEGGRNTALLSRALRFFCLVIELDLGSHQSWVEAEIWNACRAWSGLDKKKTEGTIANALKYAREKAAPGSLQLPPRPHLTLVQGGASPAPTSFESEGPTVVVGTDGATALSPDAFAAALGAQQAAAPASPLPTFVSGDPLEKIWLILDRGSPAKIASNVSILLAQHPAWGGGPHVDHYSQTTIWPLPIPEPVRSVSRNDREVVDADTAAIQGWLMRLPESHRVRTSEAITDKGVEHAANEHPIDLLRDFANELPEWDGEKRLDTWTVRYLGCEDTPYARATGRAWLVAAISRAYAPGSNVDIIPILEGEQNAGKNHMLEILFEGGPSWAPWLQIIAGQDLSKTESMRLACTRWIMHDDEFKANNEQRVDELKSWASKLTETYRVQYSKKIQVVKRRGLLIVSTNRWNYLHDDTGNRRWWPWRIVKALVAQLRRDRLQLLSEARAAYREGERWRTSITDEIYAETLRISDDRRHVDPLFDALSRLVATGTYQGRTPERWTTHEIGLVLGLAIDKIDKRFETRVGNIMRELKIYRVRRSYGSERCWVYDVPPRGGTA